ncbi:MAG: hypothetical protein RR205_04495, partial [Oscillospiraceae bacterium]
MEKIAAANLPQSGAGSLKDTMEFAQQMAIMAKNMQSTLYLCFDSVLCNMPDEQKPAATRKMLMMFTQDIISNKHNLETTKLLLKKLKDDDVKKLLDKSDKLRRDFDDARPVLKRLKGSLSIPEVHESLLQSPESTKTLIKMKNDLEEHRDISESLRKAVDPENVETSRNIISTLDRLQGKDAIGGSIGKMNDLDELLARKDAFTEISDRYAIFTQAGQGVETELKFVMKTDEITAPEPKEPAVITVEEKAGLVEWFKNIFSK